jgi:hypothetical protein
MSISFAATPQSKEAQQARTYTDPSAGAPPSRRSGYNAPYVDLGHWNKVFTDQNYFDSIAKQKGMTEGAKVSLHGDDYVYRQAMIGYLADTRKVPLDDMRSIFDAEKDGFAKKVLGKQTASAREMFDWQKGQFERSNEKKAAADQILQGVIRRSLEDALSGGDTPFVESVGKDINAASEMFDDEEKSRLWEKAEELDMKIRASQAKFAPEARFIFDALQQSTGQKTGFGAPDMREMAARFAQLPDAQRQAIYELAGGFAQLNQTDKGFWYQLAESLGRGGAAFTEAIPRNFREQTLRGQLRLLESDQPVFRAAGIGGAEFSAAGQTPVTPEEREEAKAKIQADLGVLMVERELRDLAERVVDPIQTVTFLPEWIEEGLYGAARSIPYTAAAAVPVAGVPAVASALFSSNYDRIMLEYRGIDPDKAALIAAISAPIEAGLERMKVNTITGRLPVFGGLVKRLQHPNQRNITRIAIGGAGIVAEQNVQEIVQNATFPFVQTIAAALDADMPDYDWEERLAGMPRELAVQFVALLPLSLMGIGALSYREISRGENYLKSKADLEKAGYSPEQIDRITGTESAEAAQAALVEERAKRDPKLVKAAAQRIVDESIALREKANPAALPRLEKQGADYVVLSPEGKELARTTDQTAAEQALVSARRETVQREMRDVHTGINEAVAFIQKVNEARQRGEDVAKVIREEAPRTLLTDYEANPTQENLDRLFETVRAFGQDINEPAELANFPVTGSNQGALREGIWRSIIRINEGADGTIVMREFAQDNLKRAISEGRTTLDFVRQQLNDILPQIDSDRMDRQLRTETDTDVIEAFSDVALAYFRGQIREEQIPAGLRGIMRRLAIFTRDIFRRAYNLARLRAEGKLDRDFEALLAEAVGVDQQALVDRSREKTAQEVAPDGRGVDGLTDDERFALEQELQAEMERDAAEAAGEGGIDILDAVREAGGLPAKASSKVYQYSGELQRIREASKGGNAIGVKGVFNLFRKNAPDLDALIKDLQTMGFNQIATPSDLFDMVERRIMTGRPIYGYEAAATAQTMDNYSIGSRAQPDVERNLVTLPDVTISGPANYSIKAWHGSPAEFDEFDLGKVGTGEGAQVYGYGLYFAERIQTAEEYRKGVSAMKQQRMTRVFLDGYDISTWLAGDLAIRHSLKRSTAEKLHDLVVRGIDSPIKIDGRNALKKELGDRLEIEITDNPKVDGSIYNVLLDVEADELIDWDLPLSQQSKRVRNALSFVNAPLEYTGRQAYEIAADEYARKQDPKVFGAIKAGSPAISKMLNEKGIKGIRYLDQGSRVNGDPLAIRTEIAIQKNLLKGWDKAKWLSAEQQESGKQAVLDKIAKLKVDLKRAESSTEGTYNYVIFDDSLIKILTRNGEQISVEQAAQETQNYSIGPSSKSVAPIQITFPQENIPSDIKNLRHYIRRMIAETLQGKSVVIERTGTEVKFTAESKAESVSKARTAIQAAPMLEAEQIVLNGIPVDVSEPDPKKKTYEGTRKFRRFAIPVAIDGEIYASHFTVREPNDFDENVGVFYEFNLGQKMEPRDMGLPPAFASRPSEDGSPFDLDSAISIAALVNKVKSNDKAEQQTLVLESFNYSIAAAQEQRKADVAISPDTPVAKSINGVSAENIFASAKERFGITNSIYEAGYVLPDGTMLDFSGRSQASGYKRDGAAFRPTDGKSDYLRDSRGIDHREIEWDGMPEYTETWGSMADFLRLGAVRIDGNSGTISMRSRLRPTSAQLRVLKDLVTSADGAYLDLEDDLGNGTAMMLESGKWTRVHGFLERWANGETPSVTRSYSISTQREIDRVGAALNRLDRDPLERVKLYEKAQEKFLRVMADNRDMLAGMQDGDLAQMRRTQILQALGELDGIISVLPPEVRSKIGGYTQLAKVDPMDVFKGDQKVSEVRGMSGAIISAWMREGLNIGEAQKKTELPAGYRAERNLDPTRADRAIADVFIQRINRINEALEKFLLDEYNTAAVELFKRAKPQRSGAGEKPKGKLGADVHDLFDKLKEATEWSAEEAQAYADGQWARIENGELNPYEETHAMMAAQMVPLFADWANADSSQRAAAVTMGKDVLNRAYKGEQQRIIAQRTKRGYDRTDLSKDAGVSAEDDKARQDALKRENSLPSKWESAMLNLLNFDQVLRYVFGNDSKIARQISDRQRKADNAKSDDIAALSDEWAAFLSELGGGEMQGQQLLFELSRMDEEIDGVSYSQNQLIAITMMWMQPKGRQHMEGFLDSDGQPAGKWHYNQDFVNKAEKLLRGEAKAIRQYLLDKYDAEYEAINKVYRKVYGLNLPKNQFYSPLVVESIRAPAQAGIDPVTGGVFAAGANSPSALRSRGGAIAQPVFRDAVQTYFGHMLQMAHWKAYAEFNGEVSALLGHRDTRNVVKGKAGEQAATVMNNWLQYFQQGGNKDAANHLAINQMINRMTGNFATMALFGRISTLALQVTQLGAASAKMPVGAYLSRFGRLMSGRLGWKTALDSAYIQRRIKDMPPAVALAMQGLRADKPSQIRNASRWLGQHLSGFDGFFTAGTYAIVYDYQLSQARQNGMGGQEAADYAREATERIVDEIAQPTRAGARSIYELNSTNPVARAVWAFSSESRKNMGLLMYNGAKGGGRNFGKALTYVLLLNGLVGIVIRNAFRDMRDEDDEEIFDEKNWGWKRLAAQFISDPIYGIPVVGETIEGAIYTAFGVYQPSGSVFDVARGVPAAKRLVTQYPVDLLEGEAEFRDIVADVNRVLAAAGLFNGTIAGAASISNLAKDIFEVGDNALTDE